MNRIAKAAALSLVAALALSAPVAAQVNVAGNWVLTVQGPEGPADITADFEQDGATVEGTLEIVELGGAEMSDGMVEENTLSFLLHIDFDGQWFTIEGEADVEGDEMTGEFYMAEFGSMPFTGKRSEG